jgi:hypothetical protein
MTLGEFCAARLDEDEAIAQAALEQWHDEWVAYEFNDLPGEVYAHAQRHGPVRALREVAAGRALLGQLGRAARYRDQVFAREPPRSAPDEMRAVTTMLVLESILKIRAAVYSNHPDYDPAWAGT